MTFILHHVFCFYISVYIFFVKDNLANSGERLLNIIGKEGGEQKQNPQIFLDSRGQAVTGTA